MVSLTLPLPPSVNALYRNVRGRGRVKTKAYTTWIKAADVYFLMQKRGLGKITGPYTMVLTVPAKMRGDVSNRIKAAEDFLVSREITPDDSCAQAVSVRRDPELISDCIVTVAEVA